MNEETIIRMISGKATIEEKEDVLSWISDSFENKEEYYKLKNLWALTAQLQNEEKVEEKELGKFHQNIRNRRIQVAKNKIIATFKYAAIIVVAFFIGKYFYQNQRALENSHTYNEINTPIGSKSKIRLPDGTEVILNTGSKLTYKMNFGEFSREVNLIGEGYFDVAKDKRRAFIVKTTHIEIKAFGTKFNIKAYNDDKELKTTLIEGSVGIFKKSDKNDNKFIKLAPNEQAVFNKETEKLMIRKVDGKLIASWVEGKLYFDNETFATIAKEIERNYNVNIKINSKKLKEDVFSGMLDKKKTVRQLLDGVGMYVNFNYIIINDTIIIQMK